MSKQYSIADARRNLPSLVDEAASGSEVQLTRRGKAVAIVVSVEAYERLKSQRTTFAEAYRTFRETFPEGSAELGPSYFRGLRDRSPGRKVNL
jgi:prevent-host-death family protein